MTSVLTTVKRLEQADALCQQLKEDFAAIQCARPPFVLSKLVVDAHQVPEQRWAQCVLEMQLAHQNIRRALIARKILLLEIDKLVATGDDIDALKADEKRIDLEAQDLAMLGAAREFEALYAIYQKFPHRYTRDELDAAQPELYRRRLIEQAENDLLSRQTGVSSSTLGGLRLVGEPIPSLPSLLPGVGGTAPKALPNRIIDVQDRYLAEGRCRILCVVPTEKAPGDPTKMLPVLEKLLWPGEVEHRLHCIFGMPVADAYNEAAMLALKEGATHLLCIEDDTFAPSDAVTRLLKHGVDIVGAWYPKRQPGPRTGTPIYLDPKTHERRTLDDPDGALREVYTIPMGCTLIRTSVFGKVPYPWFVTTPQLTQDSFFSQVAREAGFTLWCDTSLCCEHRDRVTGEVFK